MNRGRSKTAASGSAASSAAASGAAASGAAPLKRNPTTAAAKAQLRADPFGLDLANEVAMPADFDIAAILAGGWSAAITPPAITPAAIESVCSNCGGDLRCEIDGLRRVCAVCAHVVEGDSTAPEDDDAPRQPAGASRLKLVGVGSSSLQPDLYRSSSGDSSVTQKRQITDEFMLYRQQYIERGGQAIPINAITRAVDYYHEVQRECVKRSQNKKRIMAACLHHACIDIGFLPSNAEIADFMQLPNNGIAPGVNFIRALAADGKMSIDTCTDPWKPARAEVTTLFAHLGLNSDELAPLREAVFDIIKTAADEKIGTNSFLRSKVAGATYTVLRRAALADGMSLPAAELRSAVAVASGGLQAFCSDRIRKNTVERFLRELEDYHSKFEGLYVRHHLDARRGAVRV